MIVTDLLAQLVALPSLNPGATEHDEWIGESRVADFLEAHLTTLGFRCERVPFDGPPAPDGQPPRENLIARIGATNPARTLLVEGHMDTVGVANMTIPPYDPEIRDDRLFGRGSTDTKGPIAASLAALTPLVLDVAANSPNQLCFIGACAEEVGCHGAIQLAAAGFGADQAIVLEPTQLQPVIAHKGTVWADITFHGRSCHGSQPERGTNALDAAIDLARACRDLPFTVTQHDLLGAPTLNVGKLHGGIAANIVPNHATLALDFRVLPGELTDTVPGFLREHLDAMVQDGRLLDFAIELDTCPSFATDPTSDLVQALIGFTGKPPTGSTWYSDAGPFASTCPEIVVFGPGDIAQAHTKDEFINIADLDAGVAVFEQLYLSFLGSKEPKQ